MIIDRLDRRHLYERLGLGVPAALDFLAKTDFAAIPSGKREIDGERLFAIVQRYATKPVAEARWEMHRRYLDVQFIAAGSERMGYAPWNPAMPIEEDYDPAKDVAFYRTSGVLVPVSAGMFVVFTPDEIHAPCLAPAEPDPACEVLKVVVKCLWSAL